MWPLSLRWLTFALKDNVLYKAKPAARVLRSKTNAPPGGAVTTPSQSADISYKKTDGLSTDAAVTHAFQP